MDVRLLTRTTRNVTPTEAGDNLIRSLRPAFNQIQESVEDLAAYRTEPSGTIRINAPRFAAKKWVMPAAVALMEKHANLHFEITYDQRLIDIVKEGYDAGIRLGETYPMPLVEPNVGRKRALAALETLKSSTA